jgi:hypothetical protein
MALLMCIQQDAAVDICKLSVVSTTPLMTICHHSLSGMMKCAFSDNPGTQMFLNSVELVFDAMDFQDQFVLRGIEAAVGDTNTQ